jgi:phenylpyruvate tautomerase PptA (4-oxalocrotonate tautomerase family)
MPIQIIMTEGLVSKEEAQKMHHDVAETLLDLHGISGNAFMRPNVIGEVVFVEKGLTFSDQQVKDIAIVELRVPSFVLSTQEQKNEFVKRVTAIVQKAAGDKLAIENIWVNAVYAVEGVWGIAGKAYTNEELGAAIGKAAESQAA